MNTVRYGRLVAAALIAGLLAFFVVSRFQVSTDITTFLPASSDRSVGEFSRAVARGPLSRTMVLALTAQDEKSAVHASRKFEEALRQHPDVGPHLESLEGGPPEGFERQVWELYYPRRFGFVANDVAGVRARTSDEALRTSAEVLVRRLRHPDSSAIARLAPGDPLFVLPDLFRRLQTAGTRQLHVVEGRFLTANGREGVLFLTTRASAFDSSVQGPLLKGIQSAFEKVKKTIPEVAALQQSGVNRFAVRAEEAIRADIQRITLFSTVGLALLLWFLFRSFRLVLLAAIPVGFGVLVGCAVILAVYGQIHGVTLAFGASLIGVCVDYVIHFYCHHSVTPSPDGPYATLRGIWKALLTGAATTVIGFAALGGSSFPGLREIALFSSTGILAALAATRFVVPSLVPREPVLVGIRDRLVDALARGFRFLRSHRTIPVLALVVSALVAAVGLPKVHWNEDFASLNRLDPDLFAEDATVRSKVARLEQMRFVVAVGDDDEDALQVNDAVFSALAEALDAGEVDGYRSIGALLPSARKQTAIAQAFRDSPNLWERMAQAYGRAGIDPGALAPFAGDLERPLAPPLTYDDLFASPLASLAQSFRVDLDGQVGWLSFLQEVGDGTALEARLTHISGARFIDQARMMQKANRSYQRSTLELIGIGLLGVLIMLTLRYRNTRKVFASFSPSLLAATVTASILAIANLGLDLVSLCALLVVVSIGVDYSVFLVDANDAGEVDRSAALLSIVVACVSTVLGFGLLSLSDYPALQIIGLTAVIGVTASLLLAPAALALTTRRQA